jgi:GDPmannose 4,6-dehydratase
MKSGLVLGVNGQDGSYLAEVLIARGYAVTGAARQARSRWVDPARFRYVALDLFDAALLDALLTEVQPDEIYHMAAIHGSAGYAYEAGWREALALNVGTVHTCLEHMRRRRPEARLFYPSSVKAFGTNPPPIIDEKTLRVSDCLYSITKNAATELIHHYRTHHGAFASVGYYFNHDSPRRSDSYFLPRLAGQIAAQLGQRDETPDIATLDFWCDWGSGQEFMELTADLLQVDKPCDVIFATGRPMHAAALAADLAAAAGFSPLPAVSPGKPPPYRADISRLREIVGKAPSAHAYEVAAWILQERYGITLQARAL